MIRSETVKKLLKNDWAFFIFLYGLITIIFYRAFSFHFFADDYFFLQLSRAKNIADFLHFYDPVRAYSYKPLASETFYFILHLFHTNVVLGHYIMFVTFFVGIFYLYKILVLLTKNILLSKITVFLYGISFIHVFQLYWFGTYQEIALFCFLAISFYHFIQKKYLPSILFFILASLCKETAALYAPFLIFFTFFSDKGKVKIKHYYPLVIYIVLTIFFWSLYKTGLDNVTSLDNYKITWAPRLFASNAMWYGLWGIGFPNFMSDYFRSIFSKPLPAFWEILKIPDVRNYFYQLLIYWILFIPSLVTFFILNKKQLKRYAFLFVFSLFGFLIFLGPILFFPHKWMIRLTVPLIFISLFQAYFLSDLLRKRISAKIVAAILLILYLSWNIFGVSTHESSSLYLMEDSIYLKADKYFTVHKAQIEQKKYIYFKDNNKNKNDIFNNSQKLKLSFHDQSFTDHFFPGYNITAVYGFESSKQPQDAFVVDTYSLFHQ